MSWLSVKDAEIKRVDVNANSFALKLFFDQHTGGYPIGFSGSGISLIWSSGFGILKQNRLRFGIEIMRASWNARKNPRDYRIALSFGSGHGIEEPYWGPSYRRLSPPSWRASRSRGGSFVKLILLIFHNAGNVTFLYIYASPLCPHIISRIQKTFTFERDIMSQLSWRQKNNNICLHFGIGTLVKSNWWSIINAAFWLVELLLGYML